MRVNITWADEEGVHERQFPSPEEGERYTSLHIVREGERYASGWIADKEDVPHKSRWTSVGGPARPYYVLKTSNGRLSLVMTVEDPNAV